MPDWVFEWFRGWAVVIAVFLAVCAVVGVPHLLTTYKYRHTLGGPVYLSCNYIGPFGHVKARPGYDVHEDCPIIAFLSWR